MSKAVLISIRPEWCEKIASGEKTIEVRKTRPKLPTPFKCYIYQTKVHLPGYMAFGGKPADPCGVIGEFVCDKIVDWPDEIAPPVPLKDCCMTYSEVRHYGGTAETLFLWHISNLKIYDYPKSLSAFHRPCTPACNFSEECGGVQDGEHCLFPTKRPPQSWCYVDELA